MWSIYRLEKYHWTYPGIVEGLRRAKAGEELVKFQELHGKDVCT